MEPIVVSAVIDKYEDAAAASTEAAEPVTTAAAEEISSAASTETLSIQEQVDQTATFFEKLFERFSGAIPTLVMAAVVFVIGYFVIRFVCHACRKTLSRANVDGAAKSFLVSFIRIILYLVLLVMVLSMMKVPMSSIITILGAAGLAVSLALQNCLSNLCGGFIILFSKPFVAGDTIELDGVVGKVRSISILYTKLDTFDGKTVFVPNGKVSDAKLINYTESPNRRIDLKFSISYDADYRKARKLLLELIDGDKAVLKDPKPIVRMSDHGESSIAIDVLAFVKNEDYIEEKYNLIEAVKACFDENGIEIPYNQLDLHIKDKV